MNTKHLAAVILLLAGLGFVQIGLTYQKSVGAILAQIAEVESKQAEMNGQIAAEEAGIKAAEQQAQRLLEFASVWEPYFDRMPDQRTAETRFRQELRDSNLVNLSQVFTKRDNQNENKPGVVIPSVATATVVFEDNFARLLNWLGGIEEKYPTLRVKQVDLKKGVRPDDLQMELTVEIPLKAQKGAE